MKQYVVNKLPNAAKKVNGVDFEPRNGAMVSVVALDDAALEPFKNIPGIAFLDAEPPAPPLNPRAASAPVMTAEDLKQVQSTGEATLGTSENAGTSAGFDAAASANGDGSAALAGGTDSAAGTEGAGDGTTGTASGEVTGGAASDAAGKDGAAAGKDGAAADTGTKPATETAAKPKATAKTGTAKK